VQKLTEFFTRLEGPITKQVRREVCASTGLEWHKIYKWIYDQGNSLPVMRTKVLMKLKRQTIHGIKLFRTERVVRH